MGRILTSAVDILEQDDLSVEELEVPEWGGSVLVKTLSGTERDAVEYQMARGGGSDEKARMANFRAKMVQRVVVNEEGKRVFTPAQVEALGHKSAKALTRIFRKANELSGITDEDVAAITSELGEDESGSSGSDTSFESEASL